MLPAKSVVRVHMARLQQFLRKNTTRWIFREILHCITAPYIRPELASVVQVE